MADKKEKKVPVSQRIVEFAARRLMPPEVGQMPDGSLALVAPARYAFHGVNAELHERLMRAAAQASGIVQTPEELTEQAAAQVEAANQQLRSGGAAGGGEPGGM